MSDQSMHALYDTPADHRAIYDRYYKRARLETYKRALERMEHHVRPGAVLDIGCGYGYFLHAATDRGWRASGVELSPRQADYARSQGFEVWSLPVEVLPPAIGPFDATTMWDVVEHLRDPSMVIGKMRDLLRPGGLLVLRTPNGEALEADRRLPAGLRLLARFYAAHVYPSNPGQHLFHFRPRDLQTMLHNQGFQVREIRTNTGWGERTIAGRNSAVRLIRRVVLAAAYVLDWPYEFEVYARRD